MADEGGHRLGVASAVIQLLTAKFEQGAKIVQTVSRQVSTSVEGIGTSADKVNKQMTASMAQFRTALDRSRASMKAFNDSPLGKLQKGLDDIAGKVRSISLAAGGLTVLGVSMARNQKQIEATYAALLGGTRQAQKAIENVRKTADELHSPFLPMLEGGKAFIQLSKATGKDIGDLLVMAERLRILNPAQSIEDAAFAMKELVLGGDPLSLRERFNLDARELKATVGNDKDALIAGFDAMLNGVNATKDAVIEMNKADPFPKLLSSMQEALSKGFTPMLEALVPIVEKLAAFFDNLNKSNPEILKIGAGITVVAAAVLPLTKILSTVITLWKGVAAAAAFAGLTQKKAAQDGVQSGGLLSGKLGTLAKVGAAAGGGAVLGAGIAQGIANSDYKPIDVKNFGGIQGLDLNSGDLNRIRSKELGGGGESPFAVVGEHLKQGAVILTDWVIGWVGTLTRAALLIGQVFDKIGAALGMGVSVLEEGFARIQIAIGDLLVGLADQFSGVLDTTNLRQAGRASQVAGNATFEGVLGFDPTSDAPKWIKKPLEMRRKEMTDILEKAIEITPEQNTLINSQVNELKAAVILPLSQALGLIPPKVEVTADQLKTAANALQNGAEQVVDWVGGMVQGIVSTVKKASGIDSEDYLKEQASAITESVKQYNDDIENIENERLQAMSEANQKFADDQVQIALDAAQASSEALAKAVADRQKLMTEDTREGEKADREKERRIRDKIIEAQRKEVEDFQAHADQMAAERKKQQKEEQDALLDLDFRKLFEMSGENAESLAKSNDEFTKQRTARQTSLQYELEDIERAAEDERTERLIKLNQNLDDRAEAYRQEQAQIQQQTIEKQQQLETAHANELQQIDNKHAAEYQIRQTAMQKELALLVMSEQKKNEFLLAEQARYMNQAVALAQQFGLKLSQSLQNRTPSLQGIQAAIADSPLGNLANIAGNTVSNIGNTISTLFNNLPKKASGGYLGAYQSAMVNEPGSSQMERWLSGSRSYDMGGTAILTPLRGGRVDPNRGGGQMPAINIYLQAPVDTGILTLPEAIALIKQGVEAGQLELLESINGGS